MSYEFGVTIDDRGCGSPTSNTCSSLMHEAYTKLSMPQLSSWKSQFLWRAHTIPHELHTSIAICWGRLISPSVSSIAAICRANGTLPYLTLGFKQYTSSFGLQLALFQSAVVISPLGICCSGRITTLEHTQPISASSMHFPWSMPHSFSGLRHYLYPTTALEPDRRRYLFMGSSHPTSIRIKVSCCWRLH